jgi:glyoxylase-like metal-dependent hydrolase (beta-lactamase superfamily II)
MRPWLKWTLRILGALAVIGAGAYWYLLVQSGAPEGKYAIDLAEVRRLADSMPGEKAAAIHVEEVVGLAFPAVAITAGDGWDVVPMPVFAYQLVFPGSTGLIDTAMDKAQAEGMNANRFDGGAAARVRQALGAAAFIVVTHEHLDHIGGLIAHPEPKAVMARALLNPEQARDTTGMGAVTFPPGALAGYTPLAYAPYRAIAPGVVLIRAPGHTPGSQIVYVRTAGGREYLFIGDVAWKRRNIELVRERARLITLMMGEDRGQVLDELAELNRLAAAEPALAIVPGHDGAVVQSLVDSGALTRQFQVTGGDEACSDSSCGAPRYSLP